MQLVNREPTQTPCQSEPDLWFQVAEWEYTAGLCQTCPILERCRDLGYGESEGVWGAIPRWSQTEPPAGRHGGMKRINSGCQCEPCCVGRARDDQRRELGFGMNAEALVRYQERLRRSA